MSSEAGFGAAAVRYASVIADAELAQQVKRFTVSRFPSVCLKNVKAGCMSDDLAQQRRLPVPGSPSTLSIVGSPLRAASIAAEIVLSCSACQSKLASPP